MTTVQPTIIALDFDGVLCDGLIEYFETSWRTYCKVWSVSESTPPQNIAEIFYRTRPVIETGWEMPVLVRALVLEIPETEILQDWHNISQKLVAEENLEPKTIAAQLDGTRDQWISQDLDEWLSLQRFYPGAIERLQDIFESSVQPVIITTKEERFVRSLLLKKGIKMPEGKVFGKGEKRPKSDVLREFLTTVEPTPVIWFIEDRLKTLLKVQQQPDLQDIRLFLADWGYNTQAERDSVTQHPRIQLLSLSQFTQDFGTW